MAEEALYSSYAVDEQATISKDFTHFEKIADGAYCALWKACKDGQWFVLKSLKPQYRTIEQYATMLKKEYDILSMFDSPYVVKVYDYRDIPGHGECIVMEWIDGVTLQQWLHGPATPAFSRLPRRSERQQMALQLVEAVASVHSRQAVHRDLKPSNIMITRNGRQVKLIDFGLSDTDSFTVCKLPGGTQGYTSPEQAQSDVPDERNDIYSLGVILKEMRLGWQWRAIVRKALKPIGQRIQRTADIPILLQRRRRLTRIVATLCLTVIVALGGFTAYNYAVNPRAHYDVVARFQYSNMVFESWGGGKTTIRPANYTETTVEVPESVAYNGFQYQVDEITFRAFRGDDSLQSVIIPGGIHIMSGAFKRCPNLKDIYIKGAPPVIGNKIWETTIDEVFDPSHFSTVCVHVPIANHKDYQAQPWSRFRHYVLY